jgi:flavin reductase (DIM6/NTAB) family NADH-FMN oxidoreductase RutF
MQAESGAASGRGLQPVSSQEFTRALAQHASSVCVITTCHDRQRFGLTATAVSAVCATPPRLLVCVNQSGVTHAKIAASHRFCVNVIAEDQEQIAKRFAGMAGKDVDRFAAGEWCELATGSPALAEAAAAIDCQVVAQLDQFSHSIFIGEVVASAVRPGKDPLLYAARRFRSLRKVFAADPAGDLESLHF